MCGISGYITTKDQSANPEIIKKMTDAISHRGPDDEGVFLDGCLALGHRRLAIIDLFPEGHQPMRFQGQDNYVIVFNGAVYNFLELRTELEGLGHHFFSNTDTEVILSAYVEWGDECVSRFIGMWAFAIYDRMRKRLFCSRDRFGVKPFYYIDQPGCFAFGSEIRQLLPFLNKIKVNPKLLHDFILTSTADHTDETFYLGVKKLPPGHNLIYELDTGRYSISRFFEVKQRDEFLSLDIDSAIDIYQEKLRDSVSLCLRADVPVATCLSGGLDSSAIATLASQVYRQRFGSRFHAITAISEQPSNDESIYARAIVENSGLEWLKVKPSYEDFISSLHDVVLTQEEPFTGPSLTMQYFVMKTARQHGIPVLLDGQAQDELCLGYERYYAAHFLTTLRRRGILAAARSIFCAWRNNKNMTFRCTAMYLVGWLFSELRYKFYKRRHAYFRAMEEVPTHLKDFSKSCDNEFLLQKLEITATNLPLLLRYEDKNSMRHGVEARLPFLDHRFAETVLSMPGEFKIRDGWTKWIVRRAMEKWLPKEITWRKNKMGFEAPEDIWLARHANEMRKVVLESDLLKAFCDMAKLADCYGKLDKRSRWRLYSVALWAKAFDVSA